MSTKAEEQAELLCWARQGEGIVSVIRIARALKDQQAVWTVGLKSISAEVFQRDVCTQRVYRDTNK